MENVVKVCDGCMARKSLRIKKKIHQTSSSAPINTTDT